MIVESENITENDIQTEEENTETEVQDSQNEGTDDVEGNQYQPNYSFKVLDQELEFDERVKSAIKDKESEDYFRDLYTKAHGLDSYKTKLESKSSEAEQFQNQYSTVSGEYEKLRDGVEQLGNLSQKDFTTFQKYMNIPDDQILKRAQQIISLKDRPESERTQIDDLYRGRVEGFRTQSEMQNLQQQNQQLMERQHQFELNQALSQQNIVSFQSEFDKKLGAGAFMKHVENYGRSETEMRKSYVAPLEAVSAVYKIYKDLFTSNADNLQQSQRNAPPPPPPSNLGSGANRTSTRKQVRTLDDLRKLAQQMEA